MIRRYIVTGAYGGGRSHARDLCEYHANIARKFAREMKLAKSEAAPDAKCDDCRPAEGPYVLDRLIAEADKADRAAQPAAPKVLPGQGKLPL